MSLFRKPQQNQKKLGFLQSVSTFFTNTKYDIGRQITQIKDKIFLDRQEEEMTRYIVIQGKRYKNRQQAKRIVQTIIWFSYRKGFYICDQYKSDVGWGCLVRVGQMLLASSIVHYFESTKLSMDQNPRHNVISAFVDDSGEQEKYSFLKMIKFAEKQFQQQPGQWFDLSKISHTLKMMQNHYPMRGSESLKVEFCNQCVNVAHIFRIQGKGWEQCKCKKRRVVCEICHKNLAVEAQNKQSFSQNSVNPQNNFNNRFANQNHFQYQNSNNNYNNFDNYNNNNGFQKKGNNDYHFQEMPFQSQPQQQLMRSSMKKKKSNIYQQVSPTFPRSVVNLSQASKQAKRMEVLRKKRFPKDVLVLLLTRSSNSRQVYKTNQAIFQLLDLQTSLGIMTGFPKKAIYVVGRQQEKLIYLDPHYVQENVGKKNSRPQSFFCTQYHLTDRTKLDPSMTFCFYLKNLGDLEQLVNKIQVVERRYGDFLSVTTDWTQYGFSHLDFQEIDQDSLSNISQMSFVP